MKKEKKQLYLKVFVVVLIVVAVVGGIAGNYIYSKGKIERANKSTYKFLNCVESAPIIYNINIISKKTTADFDQDAFNKCLDFLKEVEFKVGEIKSDDLILESESYKACVSVKQVQGIEAYKRCIEKLIPEVEQDYPEILEK